MDERCEYCGLAPCAMTHHGCVMAELKRIVEIAKRRPRNEFRDKWMRTPIAS